MLKRHGDVNVGDNLSESSEGDEEESGVGDSSDNNSE